MAHTLVLLMEAVSFSSPFHMVHMISWKNFTFLEGVSVHLREARINNAKIQKTKGPNFDFLHLAEEHSHGLLLFSHAGVPLFKLLVVVTLKFRVLISRERASPEFVSLQITVFVDQASSIN